MIAIERSTGGVPRVLIKFKAEAEIQAMQHDCIRQRGWCSTCGAAGFPAADGCSLLTGRETSAEMTTANDPSHRGTTEQRWNRDLSISLFVCLLSISLSVFTLLLPLFRQFRSVCQCDCLPSIFPPFIHPFCWGIKHPLLLSITHWLVWHCHSTCQSLCLDPPTYLSVCQSISACMNVLGWEIYCNYLNSKIISNRQFLAPFGGISYTHIICIGLLLRESIDYLN